MTSPLRALILGSGFASQCYVEAFRHAGVEIVGMASRTESVVKQVAADLGISHASADWQKSLADLQPDIVGVGTPGGVHLDMCVAAAEAGAHVYCDKPLATNAADAKTIWEAAKKAGVKTAFAATSRYNAQVLYAKELVAQGLIGNVSEVECVSHYNWPETMPWGWSHSLDLGGGRMNNNFTHKLAVVMQVLDSVPLTVVGETRNDLKKAPVGPPVHDFRQLQASALSPEEAAKAEWREVDTDWAYTVLARMGKPGTDPRDGVTTMFRHSGMRPGYVQDYVAFYGDKGTIHIEGAYARGDVQFVDRYAEVASRRAWYSSGSSNNSRLMPIPDRIMDSLPKIEDHATQNWASLARDFVQDIRGGGYNRYLTFRDGWIFQEIIDIVRSGSGQTDVPGN